MEFLERCTFVEVVGIGLAVNFVMYFFSIAVYLGITVVSGKATIQREYQAVSVTDILSSLVVVVCNAVVFMLGYFLWMYGFISAKQSSVIVAFVEVVLLVLAMDLAMYIFHRVAHSRFIYKHIHKRHHEHEATNAISLFVLHPIEVLGFGVILIGMLTLYNFSETSIVLYLFINLMWGTIGHLNIEIFPTVLTRIVFLKSLGTATFHNIHHQEPHYNFGFYTYIWDKIFGTISPGYGDVYHKNASR